MKKVIVCEKPSVARTIAQVLAVRGNHDGYIENDEWIITWCYGHLVTLSDPEEYDPSMKNWSFDTLPFLPKQYMYSVIKDTYTQFEIIRSIYHRQDIDTIYYCPDPAREGITIQAYVRMLAGHKEGVTELVMWLASQTQNEILKSIKEAKPFSSYKNLIESGFMRGIEDYAIGINFSRALTLKYQSLCSTDKSIPTGRVMTCVLGMVVEREKSIKEFIPQNFYKIQSKIKVNGVDVIATWRVTKSNPVYSRIENKLYSDSGFKTKAVALNFMNGLGNQVEIVSVDVKESKKGAPLLFNMTELQASCSKLFKISPDETLKIAQKLYEAKMTTYPRTSARVLSEAIAEEISYNLNGLKKYNSEIAGYITEAFNSGRVDGIGRTHYVDDSKIEDHYAIIPTGENVSNFDNLTSLEKQVYDLIVRRFVGIFMPPAVYKTVSLEEKDTLRNEHFYASGSTLMFPGYMECQGIPASKDKLPREAITLNEGSVFDAEYEIAEGETKPPSRYTSGTIVLAMENAGTLIEDEELREQMKTMGIGTDATRSGILEKLVNIGYLIRNEKTQVLNPSEFGNFVYAVTKNTIPEMLNPKLTAEWEQGLDLIAKGRLSFEDYDHKLTQMIESKVYAIKISSPTEEIIKLAGTIHDSNKTTGFSKPKKVETYLNVPREQKDIAKALGAYWDSDKMLWYVPAGKDVSKFSQFIDEGKVIKSVKKVYLNVPFEEKDNAKRLGAKFDSGKKKWYIMSNQDISLFEKWRA